MALTIGWIDATDPGTKEKYKFEVITIPKGYKFINARLAATGNLHLRIEKK